MQDYEWYEFMLKHEPLLEKWTGRYPAGPIREEAKQVARIACWNKLSSYDASRGASLSTYLYLVVRGALLNWYYRERRWQERHCFPAPPDAEGELTWEDTIEDESRLSMEEELIWQDWMSYLPEQEARCLTLHIRDGYSLIEVAARMGAPYERVKKWKQRALAKLRTRVEKKE
ncbi:sigma-70 family RNA polymerase sigma factor [Aneurinibacillus tyrosinisolvens]|uniref:sigma-70 family RNA polymerase sigma factor n=1 Tax=Aneurinibacillus tyrosinisolvens TaxID=1443435 RepID=UPI00063F4D78|nr:sigma-70 family RNA polymerase sigma factor [Aneurinibacillus tyrosinisolvens]